jgi:tetratricopeptide (TPR) repeat protein
MTKQLIGEAQLLFVEGKIEESIEAFRKALEAGADPFMVHLSIGAAYLKLKEADKAIESFNKAIEVKGDHPRPYFYRGTAFLEKKEYENAVSDFSRALELKPDHHTARFSRATAYARLQRFDQAALDLRAVLPLMEANIQGVVDTYGIIRGEMWKVMEHISGDRQQSALELSDKEIHTLKKWLGDE